VPFLARTSQEQLVSPYSHNFTMSLLHIYTHSHTHTHSLTQTHTYIPSFSLSLSLSHTHTHTRLHAHARAHTRSHALTHTHTHTHTHTRTHTHIHTHFQLHPNNHTGAAYLGSTARLSSRRSLGKRQRSNNGCTSLPVPPPAVPRDSACQQPCRSIHTLVRTLF
jgi:hypothetical protein